MVFVLKGEAGKEALARWICWARRCRIEAFVKLQRRIVKHRAAIEATLDHGLSQGLVESTIIGSPDLGVVDVADEAA